ncbi:altronate hydrolase [Thalassotalea sp. HSM 43]|uniref:UxaA family hydrolase n=1 Tax=Thalassotalea sp. HSM 43 TaxID=2552945 RepID=UPI0010812EF4|nr:UxaA family hydrolase [Thalassotalea sp. HSM 43]QBY03568.1 altronate hydrolase [Thalassotalea sp. HSM 43]
MLDKRFALLHQDDNVFVCCEKVESGSKVTLENSVIKMIVDIHVGHKIARIDILQGDKIVKYGASIGSAKEAIQSGHHVHMHNMKSDYIPSHTRQNKSEDN